MSKTLKTIQKIAKLGLVLNKINLWFSYIGIICAFLLLIAQIVVGNTNIISDQQIILDIYNKTHLNIGEVYSGCVVAILLSISNMIVSKIAIDYYKNELELGTPLNLELANKLINLGKYTIIVPLISIILSGITHSIFSYFYAGMKELEIGNYVSIGLGIAYIIIGLLCRLATENNEQVN